MRILSLQPYFGGSHRAFQTQWQSLSQHQWTVLELPPRHWKWRMRHAAVHFAKQTFSLSAEEFDLIFCSDFLNVAEFRGLACPEIANLPIVVYFHENQFAYPSRRYDERDLHFGFTNFTSCLAADEVWFNSNFNRDSFLAGLEKAMQKWPDFPPREAANSMQEKFRIEPPGIQLPESLDVATPSRNPLVITWAARWEHDKNPQGLLDALRELQAQQIDFRLNLLGESFRRVPEAFDVIKDLFTDQIQNWGFVESQEQYWQVLAQSDVFLSTAEHEFFGIAAAEAIAAGAIPLLPNRLAYPELIGATNDPNRREYFLYDGSPTGFAYKVRQLLDPETNAKVSRHAESMRNELTRRLSWESRAKKMDQRLAVVAEGHASRRV